MVDYQWSEKRNLIASDSIFLIENQDPGRIYLGSSADRWRDMFASLGQHSAKHGHCNVSQSKGKLGRWVTTQRATFKKNKLPEKRRVKRESIELKW